jgi:ferredoxin--NADP+ reductase
MSDEAPCLSIAIVGAGPAGFYAADALVRKPEACRIDILDRLPTPYGLVRAGVAPDHQSTKNVIRVYDRILQNDAVRLIGNVELGRDVGYDELKSLYDVVILAVGAQAPRRLGISGESLFGVVDSTGFVNWYNAVPGALDLSDEVNAQTAVVVGNGNVALDIARLLAKTPAEMADSDIDPAAANAITAAPMTDIYVVGRRGPMQASFTSPELSEFGELEEAAPVVDPGILPETADDVPDAERPKKEKNLRILKSFAETDGAADPRPVTIHLVFCASPLEIYGDDRVTGVRFERNRIEDGRAVPTGETFEINAQLFVSAIGYRSASDQDGPPVDEARGTIKNDNGRVEPGVYVVGWARRGPTGVIGTNRNDARDVVDQIIDDHVPATKPGPDGLDALLAERTVETTSYEDWQRIDQAEVAAGSGNRPRVKFTRIEDMLEVAKSDPKAG